MGFAKYLPVGEGERGPPPTQMGGLRSAGAGGGPWRKDFSRSNAKNKSPAPGVTGKCKSPGSRCYSQKDAHGVRVATAGRGWRRPSLELGRPPWGSGEVGGGLSVPPGCHQLHPLPSPPLPPPGISQLIPLAASLRHLQGLKTATVPALTPGDPLTSPAPSGCWCCPGTGWAPWPPPCMRPVPPALFQEGHGCYLPVTPSSPSWGGGGRRGVTHPHRLLPACLPARGGGDG